MGAAALTKYQGHQEYEATLARMAEKRGVQVEYLRDSLSHQLLLQLNISTKATLGAELTSHC